MQPSKRHRFLIFLLAWLISASYLAVNLKRGWVPHDDGTLAQSAERILHGEFPHRDFDEPYTGGLSYLHALDFRLLGVNLISLRYGLFFFFLLWVPAVFAIACEFHSPWPAAGITLLAVAWSVPNYAASMPSWYCLFFATFGSLALFRYLRAPRALWLAMAGLSGGLSCLMKTHGLLFLPGVLLFLVYREQSLAAPQEPLQQPTPWPSTYSLFVLGCLALFAAAILRLLRQNLDLSKIVAFVLPPFAIVSLLAARQFRPSSTASPARFRQLSALCLPFLAGFALPVAVFLGFCAFHHALRDLFTDLFGRQLLHVTFAHRPPPPWFFYFPAIVLATLLSARQDRTPWRPALQARPLLVAAVLLFCVLHFTRSYLFALYAAWCAIPILSVVAALALWRSTKIGSQDGQKIALLLAVTVLCSLIQFPFDYPIYFCYVAPLAILCMSGLASRFHDLNLPNLIAAAVFFGCFAVFALRPTLVDDMEPGDHPNDQTTTLQLIRAEGLRVSVQNADHYQRLIAFLSEHARGRPILAGPDCPQVYFLSGSPNPTPFLVDFLRDPRQYRQMVESLLDRPNFIQLVVINDYPQFSKSEKDILDELVSTRFQLIDHFGDFSVFSRP